MNAKNDTSALTLPVLSLKNSIILPSLIFPIAAGRPRSLSVVEAALATEDKQIAVFTQRDTSVDAFDEAFKPEELYPIGTLCVIRRMQRSGTGNIHIMLQGMRRIEQGEAIHDSPYPAMKVKLLPELQDTGSKVDALHRTMLDLAEQMFSLHSLQAQIDLGQLTSELERMVDQAYVLSSLTSINLDKQYRLLAANSQQEVLQLMVDYLTYEVQVLETKRQISQAVESKMTQEQRDIMLRQQMKEIQTQLGESSPEQAEVAELRRRMQEISLPELAHSELNRELTHLERMSPHSADYQNIRSYIDLVLDLPWEKTTDDNLDLQRARQILDEDHYDLNEIKDRIVEHLAVMKLNPNAKAPILCFVGPPGVGKTSLGQSIARALGRVFERMSLGGLHDEAELRGHRRTYIGSMPGRIIRAMRRAAVRNPLLMLDEIDKLGYDFRGDPAAALMEILDPSQNFEFHDNYLDLPFDLSKVFFITTANTLDTIPSPLLDRIEVLRLAGYSDMEKREIARRYLVNRRMKEAGLKKDQLIISDEMLNYIIQNYTREAGVRSLERALERIARKTAARFAEGETEPVVINQDVMTQLLGPPRLSREARRERLPPGIVPGLAWTESGGDVLYVEAVLLPEGKELILTGQLGNIMQESAMAAQSFIWSQAETLGIDEERIKNCGVHIHVPAGATPKDGPSAGVTMATALVSAYTAKPARNDTAMTGEITLSGLVLAVGGIKEKILAAHRAGFKRIVLPKENEQDLTELPEQVRSELTFLFAENIVEVLKASITAFGETKILNPVVLTKSDVQKVPLTR